MLDMLSEHRLDTTELPRHLAQLVIAAEAAANAFRELDYAAGLLRDFPVEMRMPIETAAVQQWQAWQEIERRGGTLINEWRIRQAVELEESALAAALGLDGSQMTEEERQAAYDFGAEQMH